MTPTEAVELPSSYNTVPMSPLLPSTGVRRFVAIGGGALFAVSLLVFADSYVRRFGTMAADGRGVLVPLAIDVLLFSTFALHHSVFARAPVKSVITRWIPPDLERSCYVWLASLILIGVCLCWQAVPGILWQPSGSIAIGLRAIQATALAFAIVASRRLDILELAGLSQALALAPRRPAGVDEHGPYALVRHPMHLSWLLMVWAAPVMTGTHLVLAATSSVYVLIAIPLEERDLRRTLGPAYEAYSRRVPYRLVPGVY
jgi:protein-S-isoprenylcysteine O-methyltransferase Ste14